MKNYLLFVILMLISLKNFAQTNYGTPEERAQKMTVEMDKAMQLNKQQMDTIHALNLKYARRIEVQVVDARLNIWQQYRLVKQINEGKEKELLPLLTTEQRTAYEKLKDAKIRELWKRFF